MTSVTSLQTVDCISPCPAASRSLFPPAGGRSSFISLGGCFVACDKMQPDADLARCLCRLQVAAGKRSHSGRVAWKTIEGDWRLPGPPEQSMAHVDVVVSRLALTLPSLPLAMWPPRLDPTPLSVSRGHVTLLSFEADHGDKGSILSFLPLYIVNDLLLSASRRLLSSFVGTAGTFDIRNRRLDTDPSPLLDYFLRKDQLLRYGQIPRHQSSRRRD